MKLMIGPLLYFILSLQFSYANEGASALDEMIFHQKEGLNKARKAREGNSQELTQLFDEMINDHERELKRLSEMRRTLFPNLKKTSDEEAPVDISEMGDELAKRLRQVEKEMTKMYGDFRTRMERDVADVPKVEVREDKKAYDIKVEVPGMSREDIQVKLEKNQLVIEGRREQEIVNKEKAVSSSEFSYGEFRRLITLDEKVDESSMKVDYKDGILEVQLSKK